MSTAAYAAKIREALDAGPMPGPWIAAGPSFGDKMPRYLNEVVVDTSDEDRDDNGETVARCEPGTDADPLTDATMDYIAACHPEALRALLEEREQLLAAAQQHAAEITRLREQVERDRNDAETYRFLRARGACNAKSDGFVVGNLLKAKVVFRYGCSPDELDVVLQQEQKG